MRAPGTTVSDAVRGGDEQRRGRPRRGDTPLARTGRIAALSTLLAAFALLPAAAASAYERPAGGTWAFQDLFERTAGGKLVLSRDGSRVTRLSITPGPDAVEACGTAPISLVETPRIRSSRKTNGRFAVGALRGGLYRPVPVHFRRAGQTVQGGVMLLWDHSGRLVDTGKAELPGDCHLSFYARKR